MWTRPGSSLTAGRARDWPAGARLPRPASPRALRPGRCPAFRVGVTSSHGRRTKARWWARGCGSMSSSVSSTRSPTTTRSTSRVRGPLSSPFAPDRRRPRRPSPDPGACSPTVLCRRAGWRSGTPGSRRRVDRRRLVDRRHGHDVDVRRVRETRRLPPAGWPAGLRGCFPATAPPGGSAASRRQGVGVDMCGLGVSVISAPMDGQADVVERHLDRCVGLVDGDLDPRRPAVRLGRCLPSAARGSR